MINTPNIINIDLSIPGLIDKLFYLGLFLIYVYSLPWLKNIYTKHITNLTSIKKIISYYDYFVLPLRQIKKKYFYGLHIQRIPYKTQDNKSKHELINEWSKIEAEVRSILKTLKELKNDESQKTYELTNKLMDLFKELSLIIKKYNESNNV
jgi:hypothetical protein